VVITVAVLAFLVLVTLDLNGSSIRMWESELGPSSRSSFQIGDPRPIRSDEWIVGAPLAIGEAVDGAPAVSQIGLTSTALDVSPYQAPSWSFGQLFRPQTMGYFVLDVGRGFAWQWWFPLLIGFVGSFLVFRRITRSTGIGVVLGIVVICTPYVAWWSLWPALPVGFVFCGLAAFLRAQASTRRLEVLTFGAVTGYFAVCTVLLLYPAWAVPLVLIAMGIVLAQILDERVPLRRTLLAAAGTAGVALPALLLWIAMNRAAISAITGTVYPGDRRSGSGEALPIQLFDVFSSGLLATGYPFGWNNLSEAATAFLPVPLVMGAVVAVAVAIGPHWRARGIPAAGLVISSVVAVGLFAWALVPGVPPLLGRLTLLDRVPGVRMPEALCVALVVVLGYVIGTRRAQPFAGLPGPFGTPIGVAITLAGVLATIVLLVHWSLAVLGGASWETAMRWQAHLGLSMPADRLAWWAVVVLATVTCVALACVVMGRWSRIAGVVLVIAVLLPWLPVNPLQVGLGTLYDSQATNAVRRVTAAEPHAKVIVLGPWLYSAPLRVTGLHPLSGTTIYPNHAFWSGLPTVATDVWNRYSHFQWTYDPHAKPVVGTLIGADRADLAVDICAPQITGLDYRWVFAFGGPVFAPCLDYVTTIPWGAQQAVVYERRSAR
jgi:hypothetical protein